MKTSLAAMICVMMAFSFAEPPWRSEKANGYQVYFQDSDKAHLAAFKPILQTGVANVVAFFGSNFPQPFSVYVHPSRASLDSAWQKDWQMPDFKSQCWMVASGVHNKLDMLSPIRWDSQSCEHTYANKKAVQALVTHELVHVYHGQHNASPDFSDVVAVDWFVEGLAVYASGQLDSARINAVKNAVAENAVPSSLDDFWTGKLKYGQSGSVVQYIDIVYGRKKLLALLPLNRKTNILAALSTSEKDLLDNWKQWLLKL